MILNIILYIKMGVKELILIFYKIWLNEYNKYNENKDKDFLSIMFGLL